MPSGFYELLNVSPDADAGMLRAAYSDQVAQVLRRLRGAEARQADVAPIESRRAALVEAYAVLSDPVRRRRYDRYRELSRTTLPTDPDELWAAASRSLVEPAAAAALEVIRTLTDLRVGEAVGVAEITLEPDVPDAHVRVDAPREHTVPGADVSTLRAEHTVVQPAVPSKEKQRERTAVRVEPRPVAALVMSPPLALDRAVSAEDLARLLDVFGPSGAYLRGVREARRITLEQLVATTRISHRFLDGMERDAFGELPGATFVRGYLKMVLRTLDVLPGDDGDEFVEDWMSRYHRARG